VNHRLLVLGTATFLATSLLLQPRSLSGWQTPPTQGATLRGLVTRAGTSEPIPDANVLVTNGRVGPRGQVLPSLEEQVSIASARGVAIPPAIQAQLDAERAAARGGSVGNAQFTAKSDRDGRFTVRDLPAGRYTVQIEREGFFGPAPAFGTNYPAVASTTVNVTAGQPVPDISLSLIQGSAISGRVVDPEGRPVAGSNVQAFRLAYQNGAAILQPVAANDTDDRGEYRLYRIPPGEYYVAVTPGQAGSGRGFDGLAAFGTRGRGTVSTSGEALVRTFHPDSIDANGARLLALRGGEDLSGMGITVRRSPTIKVSGQVTSAIALPVQTNARGQSRTPSVNVILMPRGKGVPEEVNTRNTVTVSMDSPTNGVFEISGVTPGAYDLYARVSNPSTNVAGTTERTEPSAFFGRTTFEAGSEDVSGLSVLLRPGVELRSYVTIDGSAAAAANNVRVALQPSDNSRSIPGYLGGSGTPVVGQDGFIAIPFVNEGLYRFQVTISPATARGQNSIPGGATLLNAYVEDIREGGLSVYDKGLLVGKEAPRPIEVVIRTNGSGVQGTVNDSKLQPKAGATVVLVPAQDRRQNIALYKTATSDAKGLFVMTAVSPGRYKLFAWESVTVGAYQDAAFILKYEQQGVPIIVNAATTTSAHVPVIAAEK
jgi:hypothetical protein